MKKLSILSTLVVITALPVLSWAQREGADSNPQSCATNAQTYSFGAKALAVPATHSKTGHCIKETPSGLSGYELADFNHLSEGSDVYPYEWFMSLRSVVFKDGEKTLPFHIQLHKNFGFLKSKKLDSVRLVNGKEKKIKYLVPYDGLTASWSSQRTDDSLINKTEDLSNAADAFSAYETADGRMVNENQIIKDVIGTDGNKVKSIRMVGTNCALCHSGAITYSKNYHTPAEFRIQGMPAVVNVRGYFRDLVASTIAMFAKDDNSMKVFLADIKKRNPSLSHIEPERDAKEIKDFFCLEVASASHAFGNTKVIGKIIAAGIRNSKLLCRGSELLTLVLAKKGNRERLYKAKEAIRKSFDLLIRRTYNLKPTDEIGNLKYQIEYMATMSVGMKPPMAETIPGFGRTDAFGRISNLVLRGDYPVDNTAPVSFPWIWGLKYMGNLHYNGNSNSVILRNFGQALGLGAVVTSDKFDTNINGHNLDRLEHLVHKIKVPEWNEVFAEVLNKDDNKYAKEFEIDRNVNRLKRGYDIYKTNCMSCHESNKFVGPSNTLREYNMFPLESKDPRHYSPNTDKMAAANAVIPVKVLNKVTKKEAKIPFEVKIFNDVGAIKARFFEIYKITEAEQTQMEFGDIRGAEFFRDTLFGSKENKKGNTYGKIDAGSGYKARHLSGVWATSPFLHNGSVPNLMLLLTQDTQRPKYFNVESNEFDPINVGLANWQRARNDQGLEKPCDPENSREEHICFSTLETGSSNKGHNWGTTLSYTEKMDLINFLKYLPPEPEYSWSSQDNY